MSDLGQQTVILRTNKGAPMNSLLSFTLLFVIVPTYVLVDGEGVAAKLIEQGRQALEMGKTDEALRFFSQAIERDAKAAHAYAGRAYVYVLKNENGKALMDINKAVMLDADEASYRMLRAEIQLRQRNLRAALEDLEVVLPQIAEPRRAHLLRGRIFRELGETQKALKDI